MDLSSSKLQEIKNRFGIAGNSKDLNRAIEIAVKVATTDISVLITGESGVGKEVFSKIIHQLSKRKHSNFIAVNCGAIPEGTIDSELFGHEKGSFTSAHDSRKGYFETVNGGTIFLDEIAELPLNTQSRLLRVLESGEFIKVGSSKVQKTDVRIVAATNKNLLSEIKKGKFREDLYYRLNTVNIQIPSLRERDEDIPFLFAKFASDVSERYKVPPLQLSDDAIALLCAYKWPGNIRQLKNMVEQISVLETDRNINKDVLANYLPEDPGEGVAVFEEKKEQKSGFNGFEEKELLYKFLFEIKKDISELRSDFNVLLKSINQTEKDISDTINPLKRKLINAPDLSKEAFDRRQKIQQEEFYKTKDAEAYEEEEDEETVYMEAEEDEVLSLQDHEKELIKKALMKYGGKRKLAADELGISERTLYRKIRQYQLESF